MTFILLKPGESSPDVSEVPETGYLMSSIRLILRGIFILMLNQQEWRRDKFETFENLLSSRREKSLYPL